MAVSVPVCRASEGTKGKIDELDVMDGDIGSRIAADDPLGELLAADLFRFRKEQYPLLTCRKMLSTT